MGVSVYKHQEADGRKDRGAQKGGEDVHIITCRVIACPLDMACVYKPADRCFETMESVPTWREMPVGKRLGHGGSEKGAILARNGSVK